MTPWPQSTLHSKFWPLYVAPSVHRGSATRVVVVVLVAVTCVFVESVTVDVLVLVIVVRTLLVLVTVAVEVEVLGTSIHEHRVFWKDTACFVKLAKAVEQVCNW